MLWLNHFNSNYNINKQLLFLSFASDSDTDAKIIKWFINILLMC